MQSVLFECSNVNTEGNGGRMVNSVVCIMECIDMQWRKGSFWIDGNRKPDDGVLC